MKKIFPIKKGRLGWLKAPWRQPVVRYMQAPSRRHLGIGRRQVVIFAFEHIGHSIERDGEANFTIHTSNRAADRIMARPQGATEKMQPLRMGDVTGLDGDIRLNMFEAISEWLKDSAPSR
jgi:hypothetical protein